MFSLKFCSCACHILQNLVLTVAYNADRGTRKQSAAVSRKRTVLQYMNRYINRGVIFVCCDAY